MTIEPDERHHAPAEHLFGRSGVESASAAPAVPLTARDSFTRHFVTTFAAALTETRRHITPEGKPAR